MQAMAVQAQWLVWRSPRSRTALMIIPAAQSWARSLRKGTVAAFAIVSADAAASVSNAAALVSNAAAFVFAAAAAFVSAAAVVSAAAAAAFAAPTAAASSDLSALMHQRTFVLAP